MKNKIAEKFNKALNSANLLISEAKATIRKINSINLDLVIKQILSECENGSRRQSSLVLLMRELYSKIDIPSANKNAIDVYKNAALNKGRILVDEYVHSIQFNFDKLKKGIEDVIELSFKSLAIIDPERPIAENPIISLENTEEIDQRINGGYYTTKAQSTEIEEDTRQMIWNCTVKEGKSVVKSFQISPKTLFSASTKYDISAFRMSNSEYLFTKLNDKLNIRLKILKYLRPTFKFKSSYALHFKLGTIGIDTERTLEKIPILVFMAEGDSINPFRENSRRRNGIMNSSQLRSSPIPSPELTERYNKAKK